MKQFLVLLALGLAIGIEGRSTVQEEDPVVAPDTPTEQEVDEVEAFNGLQIEFLLHELMNPRANSSDKSPGQSKPI